MGQKNTAERSESDLLAEASSIESSVKFTEQMADCPDFGPIVVPVIKPRASEPAPAEPAPSEAVSEEPAPTEPMPVEGPAPAAPFVAFSFMGGDHVWPRLSGRTSRDLRREARYQMYHVYEFYPEEMRKLIAEVLVKGCHDLDEKGAREFVARVWKNKRLQENLQGALNATYYRELFDAEEKRIIKRSVPEIYLDDDNPELIFDKMQSFLFRNRDIPNVIHMVKNKKSRYRPLSRQLYDMFESEKRAAASRQPK